MFSNSNKQLDIGIIGAGIGGLSAALMMYRLGHRVSIYEKENKLEFTGAGIQISPNGMSILEKIGLEKEVLRASSKPKSLCFFDSHRGNKIGSIEVRNRLKKRYKQEFLVLHRADLIQALSNEVKKKGLDIYFGVKAKPKKIKNKILISLNNKIKAQEKDLIIVADGVYSIWKQALFKENKFRSVSQSAYRVTIKPKYLPKQFKNNNINLFLDIGRHFVSYQLKKRSIVNFVFCKREPTKIIENWKKKISKRTFFKEFGVSAVLENSMQSIKHVYKWPIIETEIPKTLSINNVVLVGDAAHGMLPYLAQGANKALEDSWELCGLIDKQSDNLEKQLDIYSKKRLKRIKNLDKVVTSNEVLYHLENRYCRLLVYWVLGVIIKLLPNFIFWRLDWVYKSRT